MARIKTIFGREGPHIHAEKGDYQAEQVANDSAFSGATLRDALLAVEAEIATKLPFGGDLGGTPDKAIIRSIRGQPILDRSPEEGDFLLWSTTRSQWEPRPLASTRVMPSRWKDLYTVRFYEEPSFVTISPGTHTIKGKTWQLYGPMTGAWISAGVSEQEGGLYTRAQYPTEEFGGLNHENTLWFMRFDQLEGYDPRCPLLISFNIRSIDPIAEGSSAADIEGKVRAALMTQVGTARPLETLDVFESQHVYVYNGGYTTHELLVPEIAGKPRPRTIAAFMPCQVQLYAGLHLLGVGATPPGVPPAPSVTMSGGPSVRPAFVTRPGAAAGQSTGIGFRASRTGFYIPWNPGGTWKVIMSDLSIHQLSQE